jgi:hypothetical protein
VNWPTGALTRKQKVCLTLLLEAEDVLAPAGHAAVRCRMGEDVRLLALRLKAEGFEPTPEELRLGTLVLAAVGLLSILPAGREYLEEAEAAAPKKGDAP